MYRTQGYDEMSRHVSRVFDDVGVSIKAVNARRRTMVMRESMWTVRNRALLGQDMRTYHFGSQTEGSTSVGMDSDTDVLMCNYKSNVISSMENWEKNKANCLLIQDEHTAPGYCRLQKLRSDIPEPSTNCTQKCCEFDGKSRVFQTNSLFFRTMLDTDVRNGPAYTSIQGNHDYVMSFPLNWSKLAVPPIFHRREDNAAINRTLKHLLDTGCFVVPTGHSKSDDERLEWRISTSLAERFVMFKMNITQIRCYILLKMIVKSFISPQFPNTISSFHCKTVLMYCVEKSSYGPWVPGNLLAYVTMCLKLLHTCIITKRCPHYFVPENNLLEGKLLGKVREKLAVAVKRILQGNNQFLLELSLDEIGNRLFVQLCPIVSRGSTVVSHSESQARLLYELYYAMIMFMLGHVSFIASKWNAICRTDEQVNMEFMKVVMSTGNDPFLKQAVKCMIPFLFSVRAGILASRCLMNGQVFSRQIQFCFAMGEPSDVASGRLKRASALLSSGDLNGTKAILDEVSKRYDPEAVEPVCGCISTPFPDEEPRIDAEKLGANDLEEMTSCFAYAVMFTRGEINCVPHGLKYEMFRCTYDEINRRDIMEFWMDFAIVDSLPFLYYLQYLTFARLGRLEDRQRALENLKTVIQQEPRLNHRETALNLLGHCMEMEGIPVYAFVCYVWSLILKPVNNVARWLLAIVMFKLSKSRLFSSFSNRGACILI